MRVPTNLIGPYTIFTPTTNATYPIILFLAQFFGGNMPPYHCLFVTVNTTTTTTAGLAAAGSAIYYTPTYAQTTP